MEAQATRAEQSKYRLETFEQRHAQTVNNAAANEISTQTKYENVNAKTTTQSGSQKYATQIHKKYI